MDSPPTDMSGALANIVELARLSRLTLLYHGAAEGVASRQQAAALASVAATHADVVVVFDAGSDLPVPDLLAEIEAAVLQTAPQAPLAPPMAGPVEALAFWQRTLGMRFLLIMHRFDIVLSKPDPEFDDVLRKLVHDPLDISVLLLMDEAAAPLLHRLKEALPELGETFLRLPDASGAMPQPVATPVATAATMATAAAAASAAPPAFAAVASSPSPATPAPRFGPSPFLFDDPADGMANQAPRGDDEQQEIKRDELRRDELHPDELPEARRRSRQFSSLLEQAGTAPATYNLPAEAAPEASTPAPAANVAAETLSAIYPSAAPPAFSASAQPQPDGRAEPSLYVAPAASPATTRNYRERRPMQVAAWMQKRRGRRRRSTMDIASRVGSSTTVLFVLLMMLALLGWQMPKLAASAGATPRGAAAQPLQAAAPLPETMTLRENRYRLSISAAALSAGTGRDTR